MPTRVQILTLLFSSLFFLALAGCGQTGPLKLPDEEKKEEAKN